MVQAELQLEGYWYCAKIPSSSQNLCDFQSAPSASKIGQSLNYNPIRRWWCELLRQRVKRCRASHHWLGLASHAHRTLFLPPLCHSKLIHAEDLTQKVSQVMSFLCCSKMNQSAWLGVWDTSKIFQMLVPCRAFQTFQMMPMRLALSRLLCTSK